ncbi:MAG TPA: sulfotransferase [Steroidobacteraceae bacterium]
MSRDPRADAERLQSIQRCAQAREFGRAAELADAALAAGLEHPLVLNVLALRHEHAGRLTEAEQLLRRAVVLAPKDRAVRNALGLCLLRLERYSEALEQFDALAADEPTSPYPHANRGAALFALARVGEAGRAFQRALELDSRQPGALVGLARIASYRGAYTQARAWGEQALSLLPGFPDAMLSLATVELGEKEPVAAEARLRALLAQPDISSQLRAEAEGLLGDALDFQGRTTAAFAAYTRCNAQQRQAYAGRFASASQSAVGYARSLVDYLRRADAALWRTSAAPDRISCAAGHIFVLGFPRSGTTLLEMVLEGHAQVVSVEESESLIDGIQRFMQRPQDLDEFARAPAAVHDSLRAAYWSRVAEAGADVAGRIFVDKNPLNTLKLPLIARLFPGAKILFACRDPRDVVLSCFRHRFRMSAPLYELLTLEGAAQYYDAVMRVLLECERLLPLDIRLVRHEDVVTEFEREMRRLCDFLGLEWQPAMADFAPRTRARERLTPSTAQLAKGLNAAGLGHWRRYRPELEPVLPVLAPWVEHFSYGEPGTSGGLSRGAILPR